MRRVIFVWAVRSSGKQPWFTQLYASFSREVHTEHLEWISKTLCEALAAAQETKLVIEPTVYITSADTAIPEIPRTTSSAYASSDAASASNPASEIGDVDKELPMYSSLKVINGRPSIRRLLQEGIDGSTGTVSVDGECEEQLRRTSLTPSPCLLVSGPTSLTSSVSRALSAELTGPSQVLKGAPSVTLHVETFGMSR